MPPPTEPFEDLRPRLEGLAYRMLADSAEAQDVVQDAWIRWSGVNREAVDEPAAFLHRTVTRLCLDRLKSARARREQYVGPWLPEPIATAQGPGTGAPPHRSDPEAQAFLADDLSFALLLALERLTPVARAAFLLHDVFDHAYHDIAEALGRSPAACRQLVSRARRQIREARPRSGKADRAMHRELLHRFVAACATGDTEALAELLCDDAVLVSDGGGVVAAARKPIHGVRAITRFQIGLRDLHQRNGWRVETKHVELNGEPAVLVWVDGDLSQAVLIELAGTQIARVYGVRHPAKLAALSARFSGSKTGENSQPSGGPEPGDANQSRHSGPEERHDP